ncbi:hypothetical protein BSKO_06663 [Bryopsis sp. KO-2023]|nr:hypothetical protein BSKO_06663 [Bryopsis sp. KO-2023]
MQQYLSKIYNRFFSSVELSGDSVQSCGAGGEHAFAYMEEGGLEQSYDERMVQSAALPEDMKLNDLCTIQMPDRGGHHSPHMRKSRQVGDMCQLERPGQYSPHASGQRAKQAWGSLNPRGKQASSNLMAPYPDYHAGGRFTASSAALGSGPLRPTSALGLHSPVHGGGMGTCFNENAGGLSEGEVQCGGVWRTDPGLGGMKGEREREKRAREGRSFGTVGELQTNTRGITDQFEEKLRLDNNQVVAFSACTSQPSAQRDSKTADFGFQTSPMKGGSRERNEEFSYACNRENYLRGAPTDVEGLRGGEHEGQRGQYFQNSKLRPHEPALTFAGEEREQNSKRVAHRRKTRPHHAKKVVTMAEPDKPKTKKKKRFLDGVMSRQDFDNPPPPPPLADIPGALQSKSVDLDDREQKTADVDKGAGHRRQKSAATQTLGEMLADDFEEVKDVTPPMTGSNRLHVDVGSLPFQTHTTNASTPPGNGRGQPHPHHVVRQSCDQGAATSSNFLTSPTTFDVPRRRHGGRAFVEGTTYFQPVQPNSTEENEPKEVLSDEPLRVRDPSTVMHGSAWQDPGDCPLSKPWEFEGAMYGVIDAAKIEKRSCIGHGATSAVYYATYYSDDGPKEVVLKALMRGCKGHDIQKEFRRESQILVKVPEHKNVVKMVGVMQSSMVLEYCNKGSLYSLLHDPSCRVTWGKVFDIALAVAQGMCHLHHHRIIHRDLKPGNLLMHEHDGEDIMKIADFGLSRNFLVNSPMTTGLGTWQYSAPEVLREEKYSQKADVYSYGMVVWESCTRTEPYHGVPGTRAMADIAQGDRPPMPASMPSSLRELVKLCLDHNPDNRPHFRKIIIALKELKPSLDRVKEKTIPLPRGQ